MSKREAFSRYLEGMGLGALLRATCRWNGLLVLNYHRIGNWRAEPWERDLFSASQEVFARQVQFLKSNFDVVGVDDLAALSMICAVKYFTKTSRLVGSDKDEGIT